MNMSKQRLLNCMVSSGQFHNEFAVTLKDYKGQEFSFFVNEQYVEHVEGDPGIKEVPAKLHVVPLDSHNDLVLIQLPCQTLGNGSTITVKDVDLSEYTECEPTN